MYVAAEIRSVYGSHDGPLGLLTKSGSVYTFTTTPEENNLTVKHRGTNSIDSPSISHIALTSTTQTSTISGNPQTAGSNMIHILTVPTYSQFLSSLTDSTYPDSHIHHLLTGHAKTLKASATAFALLTEEGDVYTWGDARHSRCLARTPTSEFPAHTPTFVDALGGISVKKIDCGSGGWIFGALSKEYDLYVWGTGKPGSMNKDEDGLKEILPTSEEEIKLIEIEGVESIRDFGIGNGHLVVLSADGDIWVRGENRNGQLGLGDGTATFVGEWTRVEGVGRDGMPVNEVMAGDLCTFLTVSSADS
jgi:hypothetical protein